MANFAPINIIDIRMFLKRFNLLNFKSYSNIELEFNSKLNCIVGNNGQGKTNLLDGIHYLSLCKSFFNPVDIHNIKHNEEFFVIQGVYERDEKEENIYCAVKKQEGKTFRRNGKDYERLSLHVGFLPLVIISPYDNSLITDGSEERRKFMNGVIAQYNKQYLDNVIRYNKLLANRNKLLKDRAFNNSNGLDLFDVIDEQLAELSKPIFEQRVEFTHQMTPIFQDYYQKVSGGAEQVELVYQSHLYEGNLLELFRTSTERDRALQYTSKGLHKDDLILTVNGYPIKKEGSQGQQKTYLIALKLAQFNFISSISGIKPILLLDDIFDKLDFVRVEQFIRLVANDGFGQIFITDTNRARLNEILERIGEHYSLFEVTNGDVVLVQQKS